MSGAASLTTRPDACYRTPLVSDPALHEAIRDRGFALAGPVLDAASRERLALVFDDAVRRAGYGIGERWSTSGMLPDPAVRDEVFASVGSIVGPRVAHLVAPGAELICGHFHINPPGPVGGLGPHQDIAIVDETQSFTVNGWIPLVDSDLGNGTLRIVPGSHRFGNHDRSLAVPWAYEGRHDVFWEHAEALTVPAGHLVLFDTAAVHCSAANGSGTTRLAVNLILKHAEDPLIHLVCDEATAPGEIDVFEVDTAYYLRGDLTARPPDDRAVRRCSRPLILPPSSEDELRSLCRRAG